MNTKAGSTGGKRDCNKPQREMLKMSAGLEIKVFKTFCMELILTFEFMLYIVESIKKQSAKNSFITIATLINMHVDMLANYH